MSSSSMAQQGNPGWSGKISVIAVSLGLIALFVSAVAFRLEHPSRKVRSDNPDQNHGGMAQAEEQASMGELMTLMTKLQQSPNDAELLVEIGHRFLDMKSLDRAETFAVRALAVAPDSPEVLNLQAQLLSRQEKFAEAEQAFLRLLQVSPQHGGTNYNLGILYRYHLKQPDKARGYFEKALSLAGQDQQLRALASKELQQ